MSFENEQYVSSRIDRIEALEQEVARLKQQLIGVTEQLVECNELLIDVRDIFNDKMFLLNINDSCFSRLRRWNNDSQKYIDKYFRDKQGDE